MGELVLDRQRSGLELWPAVLSLGEMVRIAFRAWRLVGAMSVPEYQVTVLDSRRRPVATLLRGPARPSNGFIVVDWDGRDDDGTLVRPGAYRLRVEKMDSPFRLERTLIVDV